MEIYEVIECPKTWTVKYVRFYLNGLTLNKRASFIATLLDVDNKEILTQEIVFTEEEYEQWGADDNVAVQIIMNKLGLTLK